MYHVARNLIALSSKGVLIALAVTFALATTLGYFVSWWFLYVPLGLMCLRLAHTLITVLRSAMKIGWMPTLRELMIFIQVVKNELAAEDAAAKARIEAIKAKLDGEEPETEDDKEEERPKLRVINGGRD